MILRVLGEVLAILFFSLALVGTLALKTEAPPWYIQVCAAVVFVVYCLACGAVLAWLWDRGGD